MMWIMENKDKETIGLKRILVRYLFHWKLFLAVFIFSFIPAILYLTLYPRTYEFMAGIQLQEEKESSMSSFALGEAAGLMKSFGIGAGGGGSVNIDDEMAILTSNRMLRFMILDLGLNVLYSNPYSFYYMYKDAPLRLTVDSMTMAHLQDEYKFTVSVAPGHIKVKAKSRFGGFNQTFTYSSLPADIKIGTEVFTLDFNHNGAQQKGEFKLKIRCVPASWMAEDLKDNILIEDVSSSSNVLEISCSDHSTERGKDMLNTLIGKYNEDAGVYKYAKENKTMEFVDGRVALVLADLEKVELDIETYKKKNEMTILESDVLFYSETVRDLQTSIIETEAQARLIDMLDEYIKDPANKYNVIPPLFTAASGEKGAVSLYNEAIAKRDKFLKNSNEANPMFKIADSQVEKLRNGVFAMIENAQKSTAKTLEELKSKEKQLLSKMKSIPEKEREYLIYYRDREILQG
ncbi:MAG: tyrosine protein kinase, partial [Tannerella sp.]|nr:tyrosine protein kinase [Tannerella sp.]